MKKDIVKKEEIKETKPLTPSSDTVSTQPKALEVPTEKFSATREVQPVAEATGVKTDQSYVPKKERRKTVVKQEVAAAVASGRDAGGGVIPVSGIGGTNHGSYSGNEGTIAGGLSGTPIIEQGARSSSRFGKKLDTPVRKVDSTISEQIVVGFEESKPISESANSVQGYNGTYRNETLRLQKNQGAVPGSTRFARSLDEIHRDQIYFIAGQSVKQNGRDYGDLPTKTYNTSTGNYSDIFGTTNNGVYTVDADTARGNYIPRYLEITLYNDPAVSPATKVNAFGFTVDNASIVETDSSIVNAAATHALTHVNKVELIRQTIDSKAGDEQVANWSPLARAVREPNRTLSYLYDLEQDTGAHIMMAYRKLSHALSYQINKASKDGQELLRPVVEMINAHPGIANTSLKYDTNALNSTLDDYDLLRNGSPFLFLKMFDSTLKYSTKADFLLQPRSFKMHLENAKSSLGVFRINPDLLKTVANMEAFSTIGHEYDPTKPVCASDYATLVSPLNWSKLYNVNNGAESAGVKIGYTDVRNQYSTEVQHPLLQGIYRFCSQQAQRMFKEAGGNLSTQGSITIKIPISYSLTAITAWELLVLASIQFIERSRIDSFREILDYERVHGYPFPDLVKIDDSVLSSKNFTFTSIMEPLRVGSMKASTALTWRMPEMFDTIDEDGTDWFIRYPWYFNETQFTFASDGSATFEPTQANMSWPSSRDGIRLGLLDDVYSMDERTARLSLDRIVKPLLTTIPSNTIAVYKYDMTSDGIPVHKIAQANTRIIDLLKLPREVGYFMVSPFGYSSPVGRNYVVATANSNGTPITFGGTNEFTGTAAYQDGRKAGTDVGLFHTSYRARSFFGKGLLLGDPVSGVRSSRLSFASFNGTGQGSADSLGQLTAFAANRGLNFSQDFVWVFAAKGQYGMSVSADTAFDTGFVLGINDLIQRTGNGANTIFFNTNKAAFVPYFKGYIGSGNVQERATGNVTTGGTVGDFDRFVQNSLQKYYWTRLNMLPFAINPFDIAMGRGNAGFEDTLDMDVYDLLYMFNFVGFRASNYEEDIFNKLKEIDTKKVLYVKDYFAASSPILE